MKLRILAGGQWRKDAPALALFTEYQQRLKRFGWVVELLEVPKRQSEIAWLAAESDGANPLIALDETGQDWSSAEWAQRLDKWAVDGRSAITLLIGGAEGLTPQLRQRAQALVCFGRATWPHLLVRAMLAEQLYRACSILHNHPYHRDG